MQNTDTNTTTNTTTDENSTSPATTESVSTIVPTAGETAAPVDQPVAASDPSAPAADSIPPVDSTPAAEDSEICNLESEMSEKHDADWYAKSAYECFIKNADPDTSDANPVAAIQRIFNQLASDELKSQCASEGKTAEGAYQFLWAVARLCKQTDGGCHISPETGYAIAMHYFQDVPADVLDEFEPAMKKQKKEREAAEAKERAAKVAAEAKEKAKAKKSRAAKKPKAEHTPKDGGMSAANESSVNRPKTPQDTPEPTPTTSSSGVDERSVATEGDASVESIRKGLQPAAETKPSKPTPPPSAQTTLFDALFS